MSANRTLALVIAALALYLTADNIKMRIDEGGVRPPEVAAISESKDQGTVNQPGAHAPPPSPPVQNGSPGAGEGTRTPKDKGTISTRKPEDVAQGAGDIDTTATESKEQMPGKHQAGIGTKKPGVRKGQAPVGDTETKTVLTEATTPVSPTDLIEVDAIANPWPQEMDAASEAERFLAEMSKYTR